MNRKLKTDWSIEAAADLLILFDGYEYWIKKVSNPNYVLTKVDEKILNKFLKEKQETHASN